MEKTISSILKYGTLLSTYALIASVLLQIFARFFLANTPPWTEEASRMFFIYSTAFAAGLALKQNYYVHLDVFFDRLPSPVQKWLRLLIPTAILFLFGLLSVFAIQFISLGHYEFSPSMGIRMSFVFTSIFILGISVSYFAYRQLIRELKKWRL